MIKTKTKSAPKETCLKCKKTESLARGRCWNCLNKLYAPIRNLVGVRKHKAKLIAEQAAIDEGTLRESMRPRI